MCESDVDGLHKEAISQKYSLKKKVHFRPLNDHNHSTGDFFRGWRPL